MNHAIKAALLLACIYASVNVAYTYNDPYENAHWVKEHGNIKGHWAGNPNTGVHCNDDNCQHEVTFNWGR
jgi:hypothetical protein